MSSDSKVPFTAYDQSGIAKLMSKLVKIRKEIGGVKKTARNHHVGYNYRDEESLFDAIRPILEKYNIFIFSSVTEVKIEGETTTVRMTFQVCDGDTGLTWKGSSAGQGVDTAAKGKLGDKGIYSAQTGAVKYFLQKLFMISSKDDPERDNAAPLGAKRVPAANGSSRASAPPAKVETKPANEVLDSIREEAPLPGDPIDSEAAAAGRVKAKKAVEEKATGVNQFSRKVFDDIDELVTFLNNRAAELGTGVPSTIEENKERQSANLAVNRLINNASKRREQLLLLLFGKPKVFDLTIGECRILNRWINLGPDKVPSAEAIAEFELLKPHIHVDDEDYAAA